MAAAVSSRRPRRARTASRIEVKTPVITTPKELLTHPLAHLGFEGSRHQIPDRLPSARGERTVSMRVIDLNDDTFENIIAIGDTLKRLDFSRAGIESLREDLIKRLPNLERLDVSHNNLTEEGLPVSLGQLEHLMELSIHHNQIGKVPKIIQKLRSLSRLKLGSNGINSIEGVEKLKKLNMLILDNNNIELLSKNLYSNLRKIEYFHCSGNKIQDLPPEIRLWRHLKDLNLSHNELTFLPAEVFLLPRIDVLNASNNKISRLPSLVVKGKVKRMLAIIDLSDNALVKFPDYLLMMTRKLDLSRNRIRIIPGAIIKKLDYHTEQQLCLDGNPLSNPPRDVCECGIRSIIQYFQEVRAEMKVHQGLKVLVLGERQAGKTSLVQTMVDGQSRLTDREDRTILVDLYEAEYDLDNEGPMGRKLQLALWDFSGNQSYMYPASMFLQQPSLAMIVFDLATYRADYFHETIGRWIDWIIATKNKIIMLLVGTHADKVRRPRLQQICAEVYKAVTQHLSRHLAIIKREIQKIESLPHISPALSEQLKRYIHLTKVETIVFPQVVPVSSATLLGMGDLQNAIVQLASDQKAFPHVLRVIPSLWIEVENHIDDKAWTLQVPLVRWSDYVEDIVKKFGMRHLVEQITTYLHETGKALWFSEHPLLRDYIILRPSWFADLLKALFRHDMASYDFSQDDCLKLNLGLGLNGSLNFSVRQSLSARGFSLTRIERCRTELVEEGVVDKEFLRYLWSHFIPPDNHAVLHQVAQMFVEYFEIGYAVDKTEPSGRVSALSMGSERSTAVCTPQPSASTSGGAAAPASIPAAPPPMTPRSLKSRTRSRDSINVAGNTTPAPTAAADANTPCPCDYTFPFSRILVPWLRDLPQPQAFRTEYDVYADNPTLVANFRFPKYIPHGFFETLTVRAQHEKLSLTTLYHWRYGLYSRSQEHPVRLYILRIDHDADKSTCVRIETRHEHNTHDDSDVETMWQVLLPVLRETDSLIAKFLGVRVERHMECPKCHALTFLGEWQTPKELQGATSRTCETCKEEISAVFLIQPKEKKRVEEFLRRRISEQQQRRLSEIALNIQNEAMVNGNDVTKGPLTDIKEDKAAENEAELEKRRQNEAYTQNGKQETQAVISKLESKRKDEPLPPEERPRRIGKPNGVNAIKYNGNEDLKMTADKVKDAEMTDNNDIGKSKVHQGKR